MREIWRISSLGELVTFYGGVGFPEHLQGNAYGEIPFFKVSDMSRKGNARFLETANNYVSESLARSLSWRTAPANSVVFAKVGAALLLNRRRQLVRQSLLDNNMIAASANSAVSNDWIYWQLQLVDFADFVQVGALPSVNQQQLSVIEIPTPCLVEQKAVTQILDTVDTQIQKTEALIAKLEKIKEGLLHDLLTRGIDQNGQLRPSPEQAPELYKESVLGVIPKEWEARAVGELGAWRGGSTPSKSNPKFWPSQGLLWVSPKDLSQDIIETTEDKVSDLTASVANLTIFPPETVLVVFRSGILRRKLPVVKVLKHFTVNQDIKALIPADEVSKSFIHYLLQGHAKGILNSSLKAGTTVESLDFRFFSSYPVPLPPLDEQEIISARLGSMENRLTEEAKLVKKLKIMKVGLMGDLLTGRVRVTPLLKDADAV